MNVLRRRLFQAFPEAIFTYGNITAADRKRLLLHKGHANDAIAISLQGKDVDHLKNQCQTLHYKQVRKSKRSLQEATSRKGRREPNREAKRNWKNTTEVKGFRLWDTVYVNGQWTETAHIRFYRYKCVSSRLERLLCQSAGKEL